MTNKYIEWFYILINELKYLIIKLSSEEEKKTKGVLSRTLKIQGMQVYVGTFRIDEQMYVTFVKIYMEPGLVFNRH